MNTAVLVIDVQAGLLPGAYREQDVLENINRVISHTRRQGGDVIFIQHCHKSFEPLMKGNPGWELHPDLARQPEDTVIEKEASDAFWQTSLLSLLQNRGITDVLITGLQTEYCVDTTCRAALTHGFAVTLVSDAHTTGDSHQPAADIITHHNRVLAGLAHPLRNIRVAPAAALN